MAPDLKDLVYVGFNGRVAALNRNTGDIVWDWRSPKPRSGYVSLLLLDDSHLIASVNGYTYCLQPSTGAEQWFNELVGFGTGVTSIVALDRQNPHHVLAAAAAIDAEAAAAASSSTVVS
jgi:outer membrane protein assembly factor BamB